MTFRHNAERQVSNIGFNVCPGKDVEGFIQDRLEFSISRHILSAALSGLLIVERIESQEINHLGASVYCETSNVWELWKNGFREHRVESEWNTVLLQAAKGLHLPKMSPFCLDESVIYVTESLHTD